MEPLHQNGDLINNRYRIQGLLGEGGIAITYRAIDETTDEPVAIKALSLRQVKDWKILELFEREAKVLAQIDYPTIPNYLDYFHIDLDRDRRFYIVRQIAPGKSLAAWIEQGWYADETEVKNIAENILTILVYLQQFTPPIIHRDLKPENIIRQEDGQLFLVDFGAVQDTYRNTMISGSTVVGTYGYMAPEQFRGKAELATDLYGLAATLLFILTHQSPADLPQKRMKIEFRSAVKLSDEFARWLEIMLEPAVEDRFQSATEALNALHDLRGRLTPGHRDRPLPGSQIILEKSDRELIVDIPPTGLTIHNIGLLGFALFWDFFVFIWTFFAASASPFFALFSIPFWAVGLILIGSALSSLFLRFNLEINARNFFMQWKFGLWQHQVTGKTQDLSRVEVSPTSMKINDKPIVTCALFEGAKEYRFGSQLSTIEQEWLVQQIATYLGIFAKIEGRNSDRY
ncbi:serine/threonine protein kinase [Oxynema aestuarii]|uniref:non-specific serine/threonine protein kinase n=1 Tax=Oxynema aestuarii AP17 TaxID=2064643 RepID=A0A6H1TSN2_9CYAN|nr:serine/threonine-protein kinase [Oxynema aestuarii]QIZ69551.1 serine/threonine protein kinase [Oxynema aestuarii AP17]RMH73641.1 MAG: serine/threonine protein kinase [Cyanobacteria bacterium J007]